MLRMLLLVIWSYMCVTVQTVHLSSELSWNFLLTEQYMMIKRCLCCIQLHAFLCLLFTVILN